VVRLTLLSTSGSKREELSASKLRPFLRVPFLQKLRVALRCESIPAHCKLGLLSGLHCAIRPSVAEARGLAASLPTAAQHAPLHPCTLQVGPSQWAALCRTPLCCRGLGVGCSFARSSPARTSPPKPLLPTLKHLDTQALRSPAGTCVWPPHTITSRTLRPWWHRPLKTKPFWVAIWDTFLCSLGCRSLRPWWHRPCSLGRRSWALSSLHSWTWPKGVGDQNG